MKVILLAGGFGTRLSEYTKTIPKPMIKIAGIIIGTTVELKYGSPTEILLLVSASTINGYIVPKRTIAQTTVFKILFTSIEPSLLKNIK